MRLATPHRAILFAVIFNALIIIALIPLARREFKHRRIGPAALLRRNLLIYGVGGVIIPFVEYQGHRPCGHRLSRISPE